MRDWQMFGDALRRVLGADLWCLAGLKTKLKASKEGGFQW